MKLIHILGAAVLFAGSAFIAFSAMSGEAVKGDVAAGDKIYHRVCIGCHAIDSDQPKVGPGLKTVVGRLAGSTAPGSGGISEELKQAKIVWDAETFDTYMANPTKMVPGTKMILQMTDPQHRADLWAYLKSVSPK